MRRLFPFALRSGFVLLSAGCSEPAETVRVRAVYERTVFEGQAATFDHEAIPGQMDAMRMDFPVAGPDVVAGLEPGDKVTVTLQVEPRIEVLAVDPLPDSTRLRLAER